MILEGFLLFRIIKRIKRLIFFIFSLLLIVTIGLVVLSIKYPIGYKDMIVKYSKEYEIDPFLVASLINIESKYNKNAISKKDAKGLMQISEQTGKWAAEVLGIKDYNEDMLYDPETNIKIGTWYLNRLCKEFNGNLDLVLASYNAGSGNVSKWLKDDEYSNDGENLSHIPFKETEEYVKRIKDSYKIYSKVYKKYIMNLNDKDTLYINLIHNIRKTLIELMKTI